METHSLSMELFWECVHTHTLLKQWLQFCFSSCRVKNVCCRKHKTLTHSAKGTLVNATGRGDVKLLAREFRRDVQNALGPHCGSLPWNINEPRHGDETQCEAGPLFSADMKQIPSAQNLKLTHNELDEHQRFLFIYIYIFAAAAAPGLVWKNEGGWLLLICTHCYTHARKNKKRNKCATPNGPQEKGGRQFPWQPFFRPSACFWLLSIFSSFFFPHMFCFSLFPKPTANGISADVAKQGENWLCCALGQKKNERPDLFVQLLHL